MFSSYALQLGSGIVMAVIVIVYVLLGDEKKIFALLVILMPFQLVDSVYGSMNYAMTIGFFIALWIKRVQRGRSLASVNFLVKLSFFYLLVTYFISLITSPISLWIDGFFFIFNFAGNFLLIIIVGDLIKDESDIQRLFFWLAISSLLVCLYTMIQISLGEQFSDFFGIAEFSLVKVRHAGRTFGPFNGQSAFAGYLVIMSIISIYSFASIANNKSKKFFWGFVYIVNVGLLVSTGNRMGFITFFLGMPGLLYILVRTVDVFKTVRIVIFLLIGSLIISIFVIKYTQYNTMIDRLIGTRFYGIEVDTRRGLLPYYIGKISERPIFGHRPKFSLPENYKSLDLKTPPHNFYLYILYTVGFLGLFCFLLFFFSLFIQLFRAIFFWENSEMRLKGFPLLCLLIFIIFIIQQYSVAFIRYGLRDYQQFIFLLFGLFCVLPRIAHYKKVCN